MKNKKNKIYKTVSCIFTFFFIFNVGMAQQKENNAKGISNGTIVYSENATLRSDIQISNKTYDDYMIGVYYVSETAITDARIKTNPVCISGVAYVKYNSENGVIQKGDLITSSSEPGVGMKATKSGMIVGVALEDAPLVSGLLKIRVQIQYVKQ